MNPQSNVNQFQKKNEKKLGLNERITQMIDASGKYSETYPYYMYRKGKYVTKEQQKIRSNQQYISRSIYDKCFTQFSNNKNKNNLEQNFIINCYKNKIAIFRQIIEVSKKIK